MPGKSSPAAFMLPLVAACFGAMACMIAGLVALDAAAGGARLIRFAGVLVEPRSFGLAALFFGAVAGYVCYRLALGALFRIQQQRLRNAAEAPDTKG